MGKSLDLAVGITLAVVTGGCAAGMAGLDVLASGANNITRGQAVIIHAGNALVQTAHQDELIRNMNNGGGQNNPPSQPAYNFEADISRVMVYTTSARKEIQDTFPPKEYYYVCADFSNTSITPPKGIGYYITSPGGRKSPMAYDNYNVGSDKVIRCMLRFDGKVDPSKYPIPMRVTFVWGNRELGSHDFTLVQGR